MREDNPRGRDPIFDDIRASLAELGIRPERIQPDARLSDDLDLDSLDWIDLTMGLEEKLGVVLREEKLAAVETIQHVVDLVRERLADTDATG